MNAASYTKNVILHPLFSMRHEIAIKTHRVQARQTHSFLYIIKGALTYTAPKLRFTARAGELLYLPKGGCYTYAVEKGEGDFLQVEFTMFSDLGEEAFGRLPVLLRAQEETESVFLELIERQNQNTPAGYFVAVGNLYRLFATLIQTVEVGRVGDQRLSPALRYIERHLSEKISLEKLAKQCYMSQSQLRRIFLREYGSTPIAYRNRLRIEKAKDMLCYGMLQVSEIAALLGYDTVYAFSAAFKKETGKSPTEFAKEMKKSTGT